MSHTTTVIYAGGPFLVSIAKPVGKLIIIKSFSLNSRGNSLGVRLDPRGWEVIQPCRGGNRLRTIPDLAQDPPPLNLVALTVNSRNGGGGLDTNIGRES